MYVFAQVDFEAQSVKIMNVDSSSFALVFSFVYYVSFGLAGPCCFFRFNDCD